MKTERRHELETNVLADRLAHTADRIEPYRRVIVVLLAAFAFLAFAYSYMAGNQQQKLAEGWERYDAALRAPIAEGRRKRLEETLANHAGEPVAAWAELWLADDELAEGIDKLFLDKSDAKDLLKSAINRFSSVNASGPPMLQQRAMMGLAHAYESLGKLDEARKAYDTLLKTFPDGPLAQAAEARRLALDKEATKQFYAWFSEYTPPTVDFSRDPGKPGERPNFDGSLDAPAGAGISKDDLFQNIKGTSSRTPPADLGTPGSAELDRGAPSADESAPDSSRSSTAPADPGSEPAKPEPAAEE